MKKIITLIVLLSFSLLLNAQTFSWSGLMHVNDFQTDTVPVVVSGLPIHIDTTFGLAHICMNITHTYKNDLVIKMLSPGGTLVTLIQGIGGGNDNFIGTCVGMDGTFFSNGVPPYTGLFVPVGNTASFNNGQNPNGTWRFIVSDVAGVDTGSIHSVSIEFTNNPPRATGSGTNNGPTGTYVCPTCVCPGGASSCDLLPDMLSSFKEINLNHTENQGALYISNATPNIGYGPLEVYGIDSCFCGTTNVPCNVTCPDGEELQQVVKQRIYHKQANNDTLTYYDRFAGFMTKHPSHGHIHVDNWAYYTLRTATSNPDATTWPIVGTGTKTSFCLINLGTCNGNPGECVNNGNTILTVPNQNIGFHTGCTTTQGIYPGNYDVYSISLNDPIPLENVCNGNYYIVSITDPDNNFIESDETNNWVAVPITLTQQNAAPVITPSGATNICSGSNVTLTASVATNYLWSNGATTQAITVSDPGSYTVASACGTSTATSQPVVVSTVPISVTAAADPGAVACNSPVQLSAVAASTGIQLIPAIFTTNVPVAIPDYTAAGVGVTSPITVSGILPASLTSGMIVSVKLNLTHTYDGDLAISLIAPSGNTIYLSNRRGSGGDNFTNTVFSMQATTLISAGTSPFSGSYKPDGDLNTLSGNSNGIWILKVIDLAGTDVGTILNWSITINNQVTETFSYEWTSDPPGFTSALQNPTVNPAANTTYSVNATGNTAGCIATNSVAVTTNNCFAQLKLKFFIQGYYEGNGLMRPVLYYEGMEQNPLSTNVDTVIVELRDAANSALVAASLKGVASTVGNLVSFVSSAHKGHSYYVVIKARGALETWSSSPIFIADSAAYDFTTSNAKAYVDVFNSNPQMVEVDPGVWAVYSGDVNNDGAIDGADFNALEPDVTFSAFGYYLTDLTGDGVVDGQEYNLLEPNVSKGLFVAHP